MLDLATPRIAYHGSPSVTADRPPLDTTLLLQRASAGESTAAETLLPVVYDELRALAEHYFRDEKRDHTLQPTALVHEAYMRLIDQQTVEWRNRNQFFVIAAKAMRNILIDHARARGRQKRGGGWHQVALQAAEQTLGFTDDHGFDIERLEAALARLGELDERKARLVELRFFAGLDEAEAADILGIARSTASEQWRMARAWLHCELKVDEP